MSHRAPKAQSDCGRATAGDGVGNCSGPPVAQAPVLSTAVAPPIAQVAKSPALAAEVGAPAPARKWLTKRAIKSPATARVVSAPTPAEIDPAVAAAAPAPAEVGAPAPARKWLTKRAKKLAATARVVVSVPTPAIKSAETAPPVAEAPAAAAPGVAVIATPAPSQKLTMGLILNSVLEVVESSGTFVDPNIVGSDVEIVGTGESQRGRSCGEHNVCGNALVRGGSYVCFDKARFAWRDGKEENVVEVFHVKEGRKMCKVGYLAKHLAFCADRYDGLCARITEV